MCERITERAASCICPSGLSLFCFNECSYEVFDCVENENSACVVCSQIKAASATISGAHTDSAASPLGQLVRPSNNGSESAVWFIDFDSQKAFLAGDEALVVEYRKAVLCHFLTVAGCIRWTRLFGWTPAEIDEDAHQRLPVFINYSTPLILIMFCVSFFYRFG